MNRREFISAATSLGLASNLPEEMAAADSNAAGGHRLPSSDVDYRHSRSYIEETPIPQYHWASERAYEDFRDIKFGVRIHWGIYSVVQQAHESWPFLKLSFAERDRYNLLYKSWNPTGFNADEWTRLFAEAGMKMLAFTPKHHEGFCMFDTKTRVRRRTIWNAPGGPKMEDCDLAYSMMETPFRRDVVKELCAAANKRNIKVDLYFSHPDWYDCDFRPYGYHPLQVKDAPALDGWISSDGPESKFWDKIKSREGENLVIVPDATPAEVSRMVKRHRDQLTELLTNYGKIDMMCLDIHWGPKVWPQLRETLLKIRQLQPDVMLRARGIGNYGDYYTPEGFVPGSKENTKLPWFVIYPLGSSFSYDREASNYKGGFWIVHSLIDSVAKGGNFMVGVGPSPEGRFHPKAIEQIKQAGAWLKVNGEAIYATRPREGVLWSEGENVRYTRSKDGKTTYCFLLNWPGQKATLTSLSEARDMRIHILGRAEPLHWHHDSSKGLVIDIPEALQDPAKRPCDYAWALRMSVNS